MATQEGSSQDGGLKSAFEARKVIDPRILQLHFVKSNFEGIVKQQDDAIFHAAILAGGFYDFIEELMGEDPTLLIRDTPSERSNPYPYLWFSWGTAPLEKDDYYPYDLTIESRADSVKKSKVPHFILSIHRHIYSIYSDKRSGQALSLGEMSDSAVMRERMIDVLSIAAFDKELGDLAPEISNNSQYYELLGINPLGLKCLTDEEIKKVIGVAYSRVPIPKEDRYRNAFEFLNDPANRMPKPGENA